MPNPGLLATLNEAIGANNANNDADTSLVVANRDGSLPERLEFAFDEFLSLPRCVVKSDGAVLASADPIFTVSGGMVLAQLFGRVTTLLVGASNAKYTHTTTVPAATVDLNAAAVAIDDDAAGTSYRQINTTAIFTPVTAGVVLMGNAFATQDVWYLLPPGTVNFTCDAARVGVIEHSIRYIPLSQNSRVVAAA